MNRPSSIRVKLSPSWNRPPIAQPAAAPAPTSSVPTRMATLISVAALVQLIGAASAKAPSPQTCLRSARRYTKAPRSASSAASDGPGVRPRRLVGLRMQARDPQQRMSVRLRGAAEEIGEDLVALDQVAAFDVAQHRSLERRSGGGQDCARPLERRRPRWISLPGGDRRAFV